MKTRLSVFAAFMTTATVAVGAAPRMEGPTSPFTYEAVGATPSLSLSLTRARHANANDGLAARQASKATAHEPTRAVPGPFTYATPGTTRNQKADPPHATEAHPSKEAAR